MNLYEVVLKIEERIQRDEGRRGITEILLPPGELFNAAVELVRRSSTVAITTGFPCLLDYKPPTETDGPLGALSLVKSLLLLGKNVILLTDECNEDVVLACASASNLSQYGANDVTFRMESFPPNFDEKDGNRFGEIYESIDALLSIERTGPNHEKRYLTMRKRDMTNIVAPLDLLAMKVNEEDGTSSLRDDILAIGIGDGGNEVGMGKVYDRIIKSSITNAAEIGCVTPCHHLVVASVSNWGGYALSAALGVASLVDLNNADFKSQVRSAEEIKEAIVKFLPTGYEEIDKCAKIIEAGARDGITAELAMKVDGMPIEDSLSLMEYFMNIPDESK